ncbi:HNH endonuclease [Acidovorax sp. NCPPB 3859]|nr:HNH endonuclease [Acidovorax sp. NCPPB 3859]WCM85515.1 HNH endonuclease [Acidovorax sp. NCPPB 3859]
MSDSSLEHAIPQFMGGDFAPDIFKIENVCRRCNNNLGLWVDAAYAKSWFVTNELAEAARLLCTKPSDPGLPLVCMGEAKISKLVIPEGNIAEQWIGPSGETITWIRPHDERMVSYTGGNPIATKKIPSTAYFFPVSDMAEKHEMGLRSFFRAFNKQKTRKIFCATILDLDGKKVNPEKLGFEAPNPEDMLNSSAVREAMLSGPIYINFAANTKFDQRFICKLVLGVGYSIFGKYFLENGIAKEALKGVWPDRDGTNPQLRGTPTLFTDNLPYNTLPAYPGAVSIAILCSNNSWIMSVSVNGKFPFFVELGPSSMHSEHVDRDQGYMLLLFPYLESCIQLTVAELIAHRSGEMKHPELEKIDNIQKEARAFHERLQAI